MSTDDPLIIDPVNTGIPDKYVQAVEVMVSSMKLKRDVFDRISVPFIEEAFISQDWVSCLESNLVMGEIPDGIIKRLSEGIYEKPVSELDVSQQEIIRILAVYICIQK